MKWRTAGLRLLAPVTALVFAMVVASVALLLVDRSPVTAFVEMGKFSATLSSFVSIMNRAYPLYISAIAVAIGFKMGLFNIGVEGQYLFASLIAAWVAASIALPAPLHVLVRDSLQAQALLQRGLVPGLQPPEELRFRHEQLYPLIQGLLSEGF